MNYSHSTKFSSISNKIFLLVSVFALFFIWCNYYVKNLKISLISSIIVLIAFIIIYIPISIFLKNKANIYNANYKNLTTLSNFLIYSKDSEVFDFMTKLLNIINYEKISDNHISNKDHDIYFLFCDEQKLLMEINQIYKNRKTNNVIIYCIKKIANIKKINICNIELFDVNDILKTSKQNNIDYPQNINISKTKYKATDIFRVIFSKQKSRQYFTYGIILLSISLITPFYIYYMIFSTILILLSIFCRFNPWFN